ncbi:MAG: hypothetical protein IPH08_09005 [Rhodocyclaceae bacterium]|jgi:hypothetical protein|nr:hypothetical protein [Rhodocyclaceae bacterium]MBK6907208.1 hypothetical protein [Rhodocyclaceae bacterium]
MDSATSINRSISLTSASDPQVAKAQARTGEKVRENYEIRRASGREAAKEQRVDTSERQTKVSISKEAIAALRAENAQQAIRANDKAIASAEVAEVAKSRQAEFDRVQQVAAANSSKQAQEAAKTLEAGNRQALAETQEERQKEVVRVIEASAKSRKEQEVERPEG